MCQRYLRLVVCVQVGGAALALLVIAEGRVVAVGAFAVHHLAGICLVSLYSGGRPVKNACCAFAVRRSRERQLVGVIDTL